MSLEGHERSPDTVSCPNLQQLETQSSWGGLLSHAHRESWSDAPGQEMVGTIGGKGSKNCLHANTLEFLHNKLYFPMQVIFLAEGECVCGS